MPFSSENGKKSVDFVVGKVKPKTALDIGCGAATYAKRFPNLHWTGVEVWGPYVDQYNLNAFYPNLLVDDARDVDYSALGRFDIAFAGDVLEHMSKDEAKALLDKLRVVADTVVVSIPLGHYPQEAFEGNPYEKYVVDDWSDEAVREAFGNPDWLRIDGEIGVYVWTKHDLALKICVYAISKNEEKFVKRWADSARDADLLLIADTGSTDGTVQACKDAGVVVQEICITPWRFDHARNASIALIPKDMDVCISLDVDEMMEPGWREEIERVWVPGTTRLRYYFDWGCGIKFQYEKIHARHGYYWHHPCHEYPRNDVRVEEVWAYTDRLLVSHHPDPTKSRGQYLDLLELSVKEDPHCPRNAFYYARELSFHQRWHDAIRECKRYLALPNATWGNERCYAYRVMGKCFAELGDQYNAEINFQLAASEAPNTREPWCELALLMYRQMRWAECFAYSMRALGIKDRALVYTCDPAVWGHWAHDLAAISAWHMGLKDIAVEQARLAVDHSPDDMRLKNNLTWFLEEMLPKTVPNVVHFVHFSGEKSRPFSYVNFLAVKSAVDVQKPEKIFVYFNEIPKDNEHWAAMTALPGIELVKMDAPEEFNGVSLLGYPQYQADVVRLQKLYEIGGIYQDTDAITVKSLDEFRKKKCVISGYNLGTPQFSVGNSTILAEKGSEFVKIWLDNLANSVDPEVWAKHASNLPADLAEKHPNLVTVLDGKAFMPVHFEDAAFFNGESFGKNLDGAYVVHLWETYWRDVVSGIDENAVSSGKSAITKFLQKVA